MKVSIQVKYFLQRLSKKHLKKCPEIKDDSDEASSLGRIPVRIYQELNGFKIASQLWSQEAMMKALHFQIYYPPDVEFD